MKHDCKCGRCHACGGTGTTTTHKLSAGGFTIYERIPCPDCNGPGENQ